MSYFRDLKDDLVRLKEPESPDLDPDMEDLEDDEFDEIDEDDEEEEE
jgi:hypothetical protein